MYMMSIRETGWGICPFSLAGAFEQKVHWTLQTFISEFTILFSVLNLYTFASRELLVKGMLR